MDIWYNVEDDSFIKVFLATYHSRSEVIEGIKDTLRYITDVDMFIVSQRVLNELNGMSDDEFEEAYGV